MIRFLRQYFLIFISFSIINLLALPINAQQRTFNEILKQVLSETHSSFSNFSLELRKIDYKLPILEKFELRPNTDRLTFTRQQFTLRASFNSLTQRKAMYNKQEAFISVQDENTKKLNRERIFNTYQRYIHMARCHSEMALLEKESNLLQKQLNISEQVLSSGQSVDLSDYLQLRTELMASKTSMEEKVIEYKNFRSLLGIDTSIQLPSISIEAEEMAAFVSEQKLDTAYIFDANSKKAQLAYLEASSKAEKAEASRMLDFVQARYTVREDLLLENRFSIGFGFMFPYKGSSKLELADILTRQKITHKDISEIIETTTEEYSIKKNAFERKLSLYKQLGQFSKDEKYINLKTKIMESGRLNPLKYHEIFMEELSLEKKYSETWFDILELYLELLHLTGRMYEEPYKNYLEAGAPKLI